MPSAQPEEHRYAVAVVGTGPAGLVTALALSSIGADVALVGPSPQAAGKPGDARTAALLTSSIDLLRAVGVWEDLAPHAAPLAAIRIIDGSRNLLRAPEIEFRASELGLDAFGYNVANDILAQSLYRRARSAVSAIYSREVAAIELEPEQAALQCQEGQPLTVHLVAGADGRNSICRKEARIGVTEWRYEQAAVASRFRHSRPHENVSIELHGEAGSVTTVPLTDARSSSLIWVGPIAEIDRLSRRTPEEFAKALEVRLEGVLGSLSDVGERGRFPVTGLSANSLTARRTALVGEAGHVLPPIGAQGLNLGFRDAASLADCVAEALGRGEDPGGSSTLAAYERSRRLDVMARSVGVDLLNRSLLTSFLPLQAARGLMLHGLKALPPFRRLVMRLGMSTPTELPSLMRRGIQR